MYINDLLKQNKMSRYRLARESGVAQTTITDICSGKTDIRKCSAETLYKIAKALRVSMESLLEPELNANKGRLRRTSFEVFKSNVCHLLKDKGDIAFLTDIFESNEIRALYDRGWYPEALYLLAMADYISRENDIPICTDYSDMRSCCLKETIYPEGAMLADAAMQTGEHREKSRKEAIPEFARFNIMEGDVRDVC